jgi:hypothetical protein
MMEEADSSYCRTNRNESDERDRHKDEENDDDEEARSLLQGS